MEMVTLRVITYFENDEWVSHMLEMDLVGCGETPDEAMEELRDAFEAQMTFCLQAEISPYRAAPKKYFDLWNKAQEQELESLVSPKPFPGQRTIRPDSLNFTSREKRNFTQRKGFEVAT